jgi:hypothetical protein
MTKIAYAGPDPTPLEKFNDDLLLTEADQKLAQERYPEVAHVLNFPDLRHVFARYDADANRAKTISRVAGIVAICLGVLALLGASYTAIYETWRWSRTIGGISAFLGITSLLVASIGALTGQAKQRWLCNRLMAERLRQFQFQTLVCRISEVLESTADQAARDRFMSKRKAWLKEFLRTHQGHLTAKLRSTLDDDGHDHFVLHGPELRPPCTASDHGLLQLFSAYRHLRLEHQLQYANYALRTDQTIFPTSCVRQLRILRDLILGFIFIVFLAHLAVALALFAHWTRFPALPFHLTIIWLAIGILAVRTVEEGLQPGREVERYTQYRAAMLSLLKRFDDTTSPRERMSVMLETERAAYQEMRGFLKTNDDARYVL